MSKRSRRGGVAQGKQTKWSMTQADFRKMVKNYVIAKMCQDACAKAGEERVAEHLRGIVQGYEDCYGYMKLVEEDINIIIRAFDEESVKKEAVDQFEKMFKKSEEKRSRIVLPGDAQATKAVKEIFDKQLSVGRFKK